MNTLNSFVNHEYINLLSVIMSIMDMLDSFVNHEYNDFHCENGKNVFSLGFLHQSGKFVLIIRFVGQLLGVWSLVLDNNIGVWMVRLFYWIPICLILLGIIIFVGSLLIFIFFVEL